MTPRAIEWNTLKMIPYLSFYQIGEGKKHYTQNNSKTLKKATKASINILHFQEYSLEIIKENED